MSATIHYYSDLENAFDNPERLGRLVNSLGRSAGGEPIIVGSGDTLAPSVLGLTCQGKHALEFYDTVKPAAETFGNHDFDVGVDTLRTVVEESATEWISANLYEGETRFAGVRPKKTVPRGETTVGLIGVTDPETFVPDRFDVADPVEATRSSAAEFVDDPEYTVVAAHGFADTAKRIAELDAVDVVLNGHLHDAGVEFHGETPIVNPGVNGEVVQEVSLSETISVSSIDVSATDRNRSVENLFESLKSEAGLPDELTTTAEPIPCERDVCFSGPCRILHLFAEAYRWAGDADVGCIETRALRDREPLQGNVTTFDIVSAVPFDGTLKICSLSGTQLESLISEAIRADYDYTDSSSGGPDWTAHFSGVELFVDSDGTVSELRVGDEEVAADEDYRFVTDPYVVSTDTEFAAVCEEDVVAVGGPQYEAVVEFVRDHGIPACPEP